MSLGQDEQVEPVRIGEEDSRNAASQCGSRRAGPGSGGLVERVRGAGTHVTQDWVAYVDAWPGNDSRLIGIEFLTRQPACASCTVRDEAACEQWKGRMRTGLS